MTITTLVIRTVPRWISPDWNLRIFWTPIHDGSNPVVPKTVDASQLSIGTSPCHSGRGASVTSTYVSEPRLRAWTLLGRSSGALHHCN